MVTVVNSKADVLKATAALQVNCSAARSLQDIMKSNLGPRGTLKMLVGGAGQIKITKVRRGRDKVVENVESVNIMNIPDSES